MKGRNSNSPAKESAEQELSRSRTEFEIAPRALTRDPLCLFRYYWVQLQVQVQVLEVSEMDSKDTNDRQSKTFGSMIPNLILGDC